MKNTLIIIIILLLISATAKDNDTVLYSYSNGKIKFSEGHLMLLINESDYIKGVGDRIECFVTLNQKHYLGSENQGDFKLASKTHNEKYQTILKSRLGIIEYNPRLLRTETRNNRIYFYYHEHLITADIGRRTEDGRICISANNYIFQVKEKNILVKIHINGVLKFNQNLIINNIGNITSKIDLLKQSGL